MHLHYLQNHNKLVSYLKIFWNIHMLVVWLVRSEDNNDKSEGLIWHNLAQTYKFKLLD